MQRARRRRKGHKIDVRSTPYMVVIMVAATSNISPLSSSSSFVHPRYQQTVSKRDSRSCFLVPYCTKPRLVLSAPFPKTSLCCRKRHACSVWSYQVIALHTDREKSRSRSSFRETSPRVVGRVGHIPSSMLPCLCSNFEGEGGGW